ncbi:hypothetical protein KUTeg_023355 [Tegillarca granosa]|uniref:Uncharacterized protein n=1 Tax=Tegillarca granosa TaxID=220873 RepID=A0ABQ9E701_TEGGR|nr:hypothetical protein KUTeg_023355 [Tegillarca granosa]
MYMYFVTALPILNLRILKDTGQTSPQSVTTDDSDDDVSDLELSSGNKNTYILEVQKSVLINSDICEHDDMMFQMEETSLNEVQSSNLYLISKSQKTENTSYKRSVHHKFSKPKVGVELTPLAYVPGAR